MQTAGINVSPVDIAKGVQGVVQRLMQPLMDHNKAVTPSKGEVIARAAAETGVPLALMYAVGKNESHFTNGAQSSAGAVGQFQLMPDTAKGLGIDPNDPVQNVLGGALYLKQLLDQFHSIPAAVAAYNAGPGAVQKYRGIPPFPETRAYVSRVISDYQKLLKQYPLQATSHPSVNF